MISEEKFWCIVMAIGMTFFMGIAIYLFVEYEISYFEHADKNYVTTESKDT